MYDVYKWGFLDFAAVIRKLSSSETRVYVCVCECIAYLRDGKSQNPW